MAESVNQIPTTAAFVLNAGIMFDLKRLAEARGISVSELVRDLLIEALARQKVAA
jgi:hypothetical protein